MGHIFYRDDTYLKFINLLEHDSDEFSKYDYFDIPS